MKWHDIRQNYVDKWVLFEAIEAYSKDGQRYVEDLALINIFQDGKDALMEYAEKHKMDKTKELYVYHTKNEELKIKERNWVGVRKYG